MIEILTKEEYRLMKGLKKPDLDSGEEEILLAANETILNQLNWEIRDNSTNINITSGRKRYFTTFEGATKISKLFNVFDPETDYANTAIIDKTGTVTLKNSIPTGMYTLEVDMDNIVWSHDLKLAVKLLTDYWFKQEYRNSKTFGGETVSYTTQATGLPKHIMTIINSHRSLV